MILIIDSNNFEQINSSFSGFYEALFSLYVRNEEEHLIRFAFIKLSGRQVCLILHHFSLEY